MALTQKDYSEKCYRNRRENGLCPRCGKTLDRKGYFCSSCLDKSNQYCRETRGFYRKIGICPVCRKESLFGEERQCIECREKAYARRNPYTEEQRERYNSRVRSRQKSLYHERAENGICTRCGKRKADSGRKKCGACREKENQRRRKYTADAKKERYLNGLCFFCDNKVKEGYKVCEEHYQKSLENLRSDKMNRYREKIKKEEHNIFLRKEKRHEEVR